MVNRLILLSSGSMQTPQVIVTEATNFHMLDRRVDGVPKNHWNRPITLNSGVTSWVEPPTLSTRCTGSFRSTGHVASL